MARLVLELAGSPGTSRLAYTVRVGTDWVVRPARRWLGPHALLALIVAVTALGVAGETAIAPRLGLEAPLVVPAPVGVVVRVLALLVVGAWLIVSVVLVADGRWTGIVSGTQTEPLDPHGSEADVERMRHLLTLRVAAETKLTRFGGHLNIGSRRCSPVEKTNVVRAGVPPPDGGAGSHRAHARRAGS